MSMKNRQKFIAYATMASMASLSPQSLGRRIRMLREERKLSQDDCAKALGIHRQSVSLIEQGKRDLTAVELDQLARFLQVSFDEILSPRVREPKREERPTIRFQPEKFHAMLLYLLKLVGGRPNVGETVLYKLLYFCDFDHYEKTGKPISGMTYYRLQFGPVPKKKLFEEAVNGMIERKELRRIDHEYFDLPQTRYIPLQDPDENALSTEERKTVERVAALLSDKNARQIEEYVHGDAPWEITEHQKPIAYEAVHWRSEPYALHSDNEMMRMMQDASGEDMAKDLGPMSDEEIAYYEALPDRSHAC